MNYGKFDISKEHLQQASTIDSKETSLFNHYCIITHKNTILLFKSKKHITRYWSPAHQTQKIAQQS